MRIITQKQIEERLELHRDGLSDTEIANIANKSRHTIRSWRNMKKLPANRTLKPIKIKKMSRDDKIYLAGFFDGEGCATITHAKTVDYLSPTIQIANTNMDIMLWIKKTLGNGFDYRIYNNKIVKNRNWKQSYRITIRGWEDVKYFAEQMIDYCKIKKEVLTLLKEFCELHLNSSAHSHYSKREREILKKIRLLNKRGRF
jgi:intein/homing endonuclease